MQYSNVFYRATEYPEYMEHYNFDGTYRGVLFRSVNPAWAALMIGRAEVDCSAIEQGFLPRGAYLVSRAADMEPSTPLSGYAATASERFKVSPACFATGLPPPSREYITEEQDQHARERNPAAARRYEALVNTIERAGRQPKS